MTQPLVFKHHQYHVGDTIKVDQDFYNHMMNGYDHAIEEMRAEINAWYISVANVDQLIHIGLLSRWTHLDRSILIDQLILGMASTGLKRYIQQPDSATEITGNHALPNSTITFYLVMNGGLQVVEESLIVDEQQYIVTGWQIKDRLKTLELIAELMIKVQTIKSTANGVLAHELINQYGKPIHNMNHLLHLKPNVKVIVEIFPELTPIKDSHGQIKDIGIQWANNLIEDAIYKDQLALKHP